MSKRRFVTFILTCVLAGLACSSGDVLPGKPGPTPILTATQNSLVRGGPGGDSLSIKETATANALSTDIAQATASAQATPTGPITGSIELASGDCCTGGETGTHIEIFAEISAESEAAFVSDMRLAYNYGSDAIDLENAPWETRSTEASFPIQLISNWMGFSACVQFRDEAGNLSQVYCDDISVEGMPAMPSPLLQLEYDLYWMTGGFGDLMRLDHETQEVSCLVGELSECDFVIEGGVRDYDFNNDRSKLLINIFPPVKDDEVEKLALLDLQTDVFMIFHEMDEWATQYAMSLSPDGKWAAYQQVQRKDIEGGGHGEYLTMRIISTLGSTSPAYELECSTCKYTGLVWSQDGTYLSFGGWEDLWVVRLTEGEWLASTHHAAAKSPAYYPYSWSSESNYLLTNEWSSTDPEDIFVYYYLFDPVQNNYTDIFQTRPGVHISTIGWLDGNTLAALEPVGSEAYTQQSTLFLTEITSSNPPLEANTQEYTLSFEEQGFAFLPHKLSEIELAFGRITQKPDGSYWIETYSYNTATEELKPSLSCFFNPEKKPFSWDWGWTQQNDLLFSDFGTKTLILPTDGRDCIDLNLLLGVDFEKLDWAP